MAARDLKEYERKRDFNKTQEPSGKKGEKGKSGKGLEFVVQKHDATRLHYDFRLEYEGVLLSWAVPKGPSYDTKERRLAVRVEDHPYDYRDFEGTIPRGEYGGGVVQVWDRGTWEPLGDAEKMLEKGDLKFVLNGERLKGRWVLVRMKPRGNEEDKNWLLIKEKDGNEDSSWNIEDFKTSVKSGETMEEIGKDFYEEEENLKKSGNKSPGKKVSVKKSSVKKSKEETDRELVNYNKEETENKTSKRNNVGLPFKETEVMLAELKNSPPIGKNWVYELKYDGYRIIIYKDKGRVRLITRNGQNYTEKMKELALSVQKWEEDNFVLDGEAVIFSNDRTDFRLLQNFMKSKKGIVTYMAFDLLAYDGEDLRGKILTERKKILSSIIDTAPAAIRYSSHTEGNWKEIYDTVCEKGMEGIIGKDPDGEYVPGRHGGWIKIKCDNRQEFVIAGYTKTDGRKRGISSLILALNEGGKLTYKGRAGTGFTEEISRGLEDTLKKLTLDGPRIENAPAQRKGETLTFVKPQLLAEIKYSEITDEGLLRQASFKGIRTDKAADSVILEKPSDVEDMSDVGAGNEKNHKDETDKKKSIKAAGKSPGRKESGEEILELSSPDKIMYGDVTKKDIDDYYKKVSGKMMPYFKNRLLSLVRCPDGEKGGCFYQKHLKERMPGMEETEIIESNDKMEKYFFGKNENAIHSAVQYGTIEFHGWGSRTEKIEYPDWMVFDLDPDEGMTIKKVKEGVMDLKEILDELGLKSYLKTSGGKGYHICVPLIPEADWDTVKEFAKNTARAMEGKWPGKYTSNMSKEKRKGKIYVDWVRNARSATSVLPYSLRNRNGLTVSMPISWNDLINTEPDSINIKNIDVFLKKDPWKGIEKVKQRLNG